MISKEELNELKEIINYSVRMLNISKMDYDKDYVINKSKEIFDIVEKRLKPVGPEKSERTTEILIKISKEKNIPFNHLSVSDWDCIDENPIGFCIYDRINDPCMDECLYCHEPEERK